MADLNYAGIVLPDGNSYQTAGEYVPYSSTVSTPISDASVQNLAPEYDPTSTYSVKDWCVYNGVLYQCNTAISTPEAFDSTKWTAKKIVDMTGSDIAVSDSDATSIAEAMGNLSGTKIAKKSLSAIFSNSNISANIGNAKTLFELDNDASIDYIGAFCNGQPLVAFTNSTGGLFCGAVLGSLNATYAFTAICFYH